jgi:hypothetical protein
MNREIMSNSMHTVINKHLIKLTRRGKYQLDTYFYTKTATTATLQDSVPTFAKKTEYNGMVK